MASAVLFDLDGVLVDSRAAITGCVNHALVECGLPSREVADLHRVIGPPLSVAFAELVGEPIESALVAACVAAYRERYAEASLVETVVVDGMPSALDALAGGHRLAVATSKPRAFAEPILEALSLASWFEVVAGPGLDALAESKTATVAAALGSLGEVSDAVMVGDRSFDVVGAHANGLPAIGVTWGIGSAAELAEAGADVIVDAPAELSAAVGELLRR
jgi:phosphoglycolate phosphatase